MYHPFFAQELEEIAEELGLEHEDYERLEAYVSIMFTYPTGGNPQEAIRQDLDSIIRHEEEAFLGEHNSEADFVLYYLDNYVDYEIPGFICIDYQATWDNNLRHDFTFDNGFVWSDA